ncbi:MAG TPA: hypothetical protein VFA82_07610 [Gaiellaceae bacterium]|nr:hypothetical protein [Gaiellaceae bacterium]
MDPGDDDNIEFDFFEDEPATTEAASREPRVRLPRRGGGGRQRRRPGGPPRGIQPLVRLLLLVGVVVALLVVFGLLIQSCASTSKHDAYSSYMTQVGRIAHGSADDGSAVGTALTTGSAAADIAKSLDGIAEQERQNVAAAERLDPPGRLRPENLDLVQALQLRVEGVQNLADVLRSTASSKSTAGAALLAEQGNRLVASDVVYDDLFKAPATAEMKAQGVSGVAVPESTFVASADLLSEHSFTLMLQRLQGASTGGTVTGLHGTNIVETKVLPAGTALSETTETTVKASTDLAFAVVVKDSGDSQEVNIKVTLTLQRTSGGKAVVQTKTIRVINPGQEATVTFKGLNVAGFFAINSKLRIDVAPVPGEKITSNNKATYPVIFSL